MAQAGYVFNMARNIYLYCLNNIIITLISIIFIFQIMQIVIIILLLLFSFSTHLGLTFTSGQAPTSNHGLRFLLLGLIIFGFVYCSNRLNILIQPFNLFYYLRNMLLCLFHILILLLPIMHSIQATCFGPIYQSSPRIVYVALFFMQ